MCGAGGKKGEKKKGERDRRGEERGPKGKGKKDRGKADTELGERKRRQVKGKSWGEGEREVWVWGAEKGRNEGWSLGTAHPWLHHLICLLLLIQNHNRVKSKQVWRPQAPAVFDIKLDFSLSMEALSHPAPGDSPEMWGLGPNTCIGGGGGVRGKKRGKDTLVLGSLV